MANDIAAAEDGSPVSLYAEAVGAAIRTIRERQKMSASKLARDAQISYTTLHHIERGRPADLKTLLAIAVALNVTIGEIVGIAEARDGGRASGEAVRPTRETSEPVARWGTDGERFALSAEQAAFLDKLCWSFLRAADATGRHSIRALLEDLAVAFGLALDRAAGESAKRAVANKRGSGR